MFGNRDKASKDNQRFYVKSVDNIKSFGRVTVLVDRETGVNYLHTWAGTGNGLTVLMDENGNPIIDNV